MTAGTEKLYSPSEAGRAIGVSGSTVKRIASELKLSPLLTMSGARLFTADQVEQIRGERERRKRESERR